MTEHPLGFTVQFASAIYEMSHRLDDLPVYVELELVACGVSDADRTRIRVTSKAGEFGFPGIVSSVDVVDDPKFWPSEASGVQHPTDKRLGFFRISETEEGSRC